MFTKLERTNINGDISKNTLLTLLNPIEGYLFKYSWKGTVTVKYDTLREGLVFYEWDQEASAMGNELFSIMYRGNEITNEIPGELLRSENSGDFYYQITEKGKNFGITKDMIDSSVITLI